MIRALYRLLLWLHPRFFRRQFGDEMLWIFDQTVSAQGTAALFADGLASLARQWLLRSGAWKAAAALGLALVQVSLGSLAMQRLMPHRIAQLAADPSRLSLAGWAHQRITVPMVMYLTLFVVGGLVLLIVGLSCWIKGFSARRLPAACRVR